MIRRYSPDPAIIGFIQGCSDIGCTPIIL